MTRGCSFHFVCFVMVLGLASHAWAQSNNQCDQPGESPDVIVGDLIDINRYGIVGDFTGFAIGTESCNIGTCWLNWLSGPNHPVIGQTMFRLHNGRFEQIGQSWLKHGFATLDDPLCSNDCIPGGGNHLGVNCSDPYWAGLNGSQTGLGPKFEVNPTAGTHLHPYTAQGQTGNATYKRLQIRTSDMNPALFPGALYFGEGQYVTADDAAAGNNANNNSYRQAEVTGTNPNFNFTWGGPTVRMLPAIFAWSAEDATVEAEWLLGDVIGADKVTDLGGGMWHYEYAIQNVLSNRAIRSLRIPLPHGVVLQNIGFHDVPYHSGEPYDGTDWSVTVETGSGQNYIEWATQTWAQNPNANALRWGTLYNFRFDANVPPALSLSRLGMFLPGDPAEVRWGARAPDRCGDLFCEGTETEETCAADCFTALSGAGRVPDGAEIPGEPLTARLEANGDVTLEWSASCRVEDTDYEVYEGPIGSFTGHAVKACSTDGATTWTFAPGAGSTYYLVVPRTGSEEGSYGEDSNGVPRGQGASSCMPQSIAACR